MRWLQEFKKFALKGNMVDLAIGVIIGTVFGNVINSLVSDVIMPPIGLIVGGVDFSSLSLKMHLPGSATPPVELKYGAFLNTLINFVIISAVIFFVVKIMNKLQGNLPEDRTQTMECPECLMPIPRKARKCGHCGSVITKNLK